MSDRVDTAMDDLLRSREAGRLAHAYVVSGNPRGNAMELACRLIEALLELPPERVQAVRNRTHPDIHWVEPENKIREISVAQIRELCKALSQTAYEDGWRVGIILFADRLGEEASNAFLKTLEEPPKRCLLLLLTDHPEQLLNTIASRCQRVMLGQGEGVTQAEWMDEFMELLRAGIPGSPLDALRTAAELDDLLKTLQKKIQDEEPDPELEGEEKKKVKAARIESKLLEARRSLLRTLLYWRRDVLFTVMGRTDLLYFPEEQEALQRQAEGLDERKALALMDEVDRLKTRLDRKMPIPFTAAASFLHAGLVAAGQR